MIVISQALVLSAGEAALDADSPLIGWHSVVTPAGLTTSNADASYPVSNLANPATHLDWRMTTAALSWVVIETNYSDPIDYVAIARHNFHSAQIAVYVEGYIGGVWTMLTDWTLLPDDGPALFRFSPSIASHIRLWFGAGAAPARCAVVYAGKLLVMERRVYAGHTPLPHARKAICTKPMMKSSFTEKRVQLWKVKPFRKPDST